MTKRSYPRTDGRPPYTIDDDLEIDSNLETYESKLKIELQQEIERRNTNRPSADQLPMVGTKNELVEVLQADDDEELAGEDS